MTVRGSIRAEAFGGLLIMAGEGTARKLTNLNPRSYLGIAAALPMGA